MDVIAFFGCHPCKVRTEQFWDFNYYEGANPPLSECQAPDLRPLEAMETAKKNFRRLMEFLKAQDNIRITTFGDLMNRFSYQKDFITTSELNDYAKAILNKESIIIDSDFSPAEMFTAYVCALTDYGETVKLPKKTRRESPLGPMEMPDSIPGIPKISEIQAFRLAGEAYSWIRDRGYLPSYLTVGDNRIGTGSLLALFCQLYLDILSGEPEESYNIIPFDPYPRENEAAIISEVGGCKYWPVHQPDLDMSHLVHLTRLQLWTLKPAMEK